MSGTLLLLVAVLVGAAVLGGVLSAVRWLPARRRRRRDERLLAVRAGVAVREAHGTGLTGGDGREADLLAALALEPTADGRAALCRRLGRVGSAAAVEPLVGVLCSNDTVAARLAAATALSTVGDASAAVGLLDALHDTDDDVATTAARALRRVAPEALALAGCCGVSRRRAALAGHPAP